MTGRCERGCRPHRLAQCAWGSAPEMSSSDLRQRRLQALGVACAVRSDRARSKSQIGDGVITLAQVPGSPPPESDGCSLRELLMCQQRWGRRKGKGFLTRHRISEPGSSTNAARFRLSQSAYENFNLDFRVCVLIRLSYGRMNSAKSERVRSCL